MGVVLTNEPGADSWPVTAATFILVHKSQDKLVRAARLLEFFDWAFKNGAKSAEALDYVPLPEAVTTKSAPPGGEVKGADGKAVWEVSPYRPGRCPPWRTSERRAIAVLTSAGRRAPRHWCRPWPYLQGKPVHERGNG